MMQQRVRFAPSPDRHHQGVGDELCCHRSAHRPADHAPREQIDHGSHIEPALRCPDIGEVSDPFAVGSGGFEAAVEHVGSDDGDLPLVDAAKWADTAVEMPSDLSSRALFDWLSPAAPKVDENGLLYLRDALAAMPIAVLVEDGVPRS